MPSHSPEPTQPLNTSPSQQPCSDNTLHEVNGPQRTENTYLDNPLGKRISQMEQSVFDPDQNGQPIIRLLSQVHNGNPESRFIYAAMLARGIAVDENRAEAVKLFEYADRMGVSVPEKYLEALKA